MPNLYLPLFSHFGPNAARLGIEMPTLPLFVFEHYAGVALALLFLGGLSVAATVKWGCQKRSVVLNLVGCVLSWLWIFLMETSFHVTLLQLLQVAQAVGK